MLHRYIESQQYFTLAPGFQVELPGVQWGHQESHWSGHGAIGIPLDSHWFCTEVPEGIVDLLPKCRGDRCGRTNVLHKTLEKFMKAWQSWCRWTTLHLCLLGSGPSSSSACTPCMHLIPTWMLLEGYLDKQLVTICITLMYLECNFVLLLLRNAGCQGKIYYGTPAEPEY